MESASIIRKYMCMMEVWERVFFYFMAFSMKLSFLLSVIFFIFSGAFDLQKIPVQRDPIRVTEYIEQDDITTAFRTPNYDGVKISSYRRYFCITIATQFYACILLIIHVILKPIYVCMCVCVFVVCAYMHTHIPMSKGHGPGDLITLFDYKCSIRDGLQV